MSAITCFWLGQVLSVTVMQNIVQVPNSVLIVTSYWLSNDS